MRPLAEVLAEHMSATVDLGTPRRYTEHGGWNISCSCGALICSHGGECTCHAAHLAAVTHEWYAEWLTSSEAVEVVTQVQSDAYWSKGSPKTWPEYARLALAALAAHAKGEA